MTTGIWIGLGIFLLALLLGTVWVGYQVVKSWKQLRALSSLLDEVGKLTRSAEDIQTRLTSVEQQLAISSGRSTASPSRSHAPGRSRTLPPRCDR